MKLICFGQKNGRDCLGSKQQHPFTPIGSTYVEVEHNNTSPNVPFVEEALQSD